MADQQRFFENMKALFNPGSIAVIGASDNPEKLGFHVMKSLRSGGYPGAVVPVNPGAETIMETKAYPSLGAYRGKIDLAIVVLPAGLVPGILEECVKKGIRGVVLITAGFKEIDDPKGGELQEEILRGSFTKRTSP
jgi:acyl-CoA synthetase (NDP forming)